MPTERPASGESANETADGGADRGPEATMEEIAQRVAELLAYQSREPLRLLPTQAVARTLAVSEDWVREHAAELGAIRIGDGAKGTLRFDAARVNAALDGRRLDRPHEGQRRRPGPRRRSLGTVPAVVPADVKDW